MSFLILYLLWVLTIFLCSWRDLNLTWALIGAITDNDDIQHGLFPPPGKNASTAKGGGKSKKDWHWEICKAIFTSHNIYSNAFAQATNP